ncbi:transglutaminase TgpA family protein [Streptacidiphilus carbonis]|uniref:transglutaminase TgpA family protein n=1 Tax=Streptacidiphilus carbonis TaxID=105422 RepID=UPI0005A8C892|nr:DUF3488 and transglutaminase-like domain-containing protein [Streptacidiphilus carbonis]
MNGRTRIAFSGAAATLLTALCLWPLVSPAYWLVQAGFVIVLVTSAGLGLRRLAVPRPLVPVAQLLLIVLLLTLMYASSTAVGGLLPGPGAWQTLTGEISDGITDMGQYAAPAPAHQGLRLILVGSVVLIALVVDLLVATYQRVALAGLPLLALYSVGTGLHPHGALWLYFLLSAFGYLSLLMAEGQDRLSRWGRVFHGTPATLAGTTGGNPLSSTGYRIAGAALAIGLLLPLALPGLGSGLVGKIGHGGGIGADGNIITAVNPLASLGASLNKSVNVNILTYTTSANSPGDQYLRIVDLDAFNGVAWTPSEHQVQSVPNPLPYPSGLANNTPQLAVQTKVSTQSGYVQQWLPMPYPASSVQVPGDWKYEPEGRTLIGDAGQNAGGLQYTVNSLALEPSEDALRTAGSPPADIVKNYTTLPKGFPAVIHDTAVSVTHGAGTAYDKAVALQNWFTTTGGFSYDTTVKDDTSSNAMVDFLRNRKGFCVHFAGTMAAMARSLGIPARVAIGFTPGEQQPDGSWKVGTKNAHAWPELYFAGVGWLRFEPTPHVGFTPDYTVVTTSGGTSVATTASAAPSVSTGPTAGSSAACPLQKQRAGFCGEDTGTGSVGVKAASASFTPLELAGLALAGLLVLLLLTPMLWRLRARSRRLRRRGPRGPGRPGASAGSGASGASGVSSGSPRTGRDGGGLELSDQQVLSVWREMIDSAWDLGIPPDEAETPRRTVARIVELGGLEQEPRAAAGRLALATEQVLYAPRADPPTALRQDVRAVRNGLRASARRSVRIRAVLFPPSSARLVRGLREARQSLVERARRRRAADGEEQ